MYITLIIIKSPGRKICTDELGNTTLDLLYKQVTLEPQLKWQGLLGLMPNLQGKSSHVIKMKEEYMQRAYAEHTLFWAFFCLRSSINVWIMVMAEERLETWHHSAIWKTKAKW